MRHLLQLGRPELSGSYLSARQKNTRANNNNTLSNLTPQRPRERKKYAKT